MGKSQNMIGFKLDLTWKISLQSSKTAVEIIFNNCFARYKRRKLSSKLREKYKHFEVKFHAKYTFMLTQSVPAAT